MKNTDPSNDWAAGPYRGMLELARAHPRLFTVLLLVMAAVLTVVLLYQHSPPTVVYEGF